MEIKSFMYGEKELVLKEPVNQQVFLEKLIELCNSSCKEDAVDLGGGCWRCATFPNFKSWKIPHKPWDENGEKKWGIGYEGKKPENLHGAQLVVKKNSEGVYRVIREMMMPTHFDRFDKTLRYQHCN